MSRYTCLVIVLLACCGCTHIKLQRKTINQGSTLTGIQYQQVLDNLAMFSCDPNSLAWHVKVTGGLVQISDQGNLAVVPAQVGTAQLAPNLAASRNVLEQWNVDAVIESDDLELLQIAYQKAIDPADATRQIKRKAFEKISELSSTYQIVLAKEVVDEMIETLRIGASAEQMRSLDSTSARFAQLYKRLEDVTMNSVHPGEAHNNLAAAEIAAAKREIITLIGNVSHQPFLAGYTLDRPQRSVAVIEQAEDKIKGLLDLVTDRGGETNQFLTPWVSRGCKQDVPRCACFVGHYKGCNGDCYVWVTPEHVKNLRDFTLIVLSLVPPEVQEFSTPRLGVGAAFSPGSS